MGSTINSATMRTRAASHSTRRTARTAPRADSVELRGLSEGERAQLGTPSNSRVHPSAREWVEVRRFLLEKSQRRDPELRPEMTAYTPGETVALLRRSEIRAWHEQMRRYKLPDDVKTVVFVPCAATKPWDGATSGIYKSYNQLRDEVRKGRFPHAFFVTISEPLGIVPEDHWGKFPRYDDPGLFRNDSARAGRTTTREWLQHFGKNFVTPFDEKSYQKAIDGLSGVIADFARNNARAGRRFISFVDDAEGVGTHTDMLVHAQEKFAFIHPEDMHPKREAPRAEPYDLIKKTLAAATRPYPSKRVHVRP